MEMFDNQQLGMTDFTQRVNYRRALEGELERTIGRCAAYSRRRCTWRCMKPRAFAPQHARRRVRRLKLRVAKSRA
jgi:flagellar M-ring protein FliF